MIGITLKHLRYFDALARRKHFGRAAETCAISQPALSIQIKELEVMLGAPLVERGSRQIRLTALGEDFLSRCRKILIEVEELNELVRSAEGPLAGRLRLGIIPTIAPYLLPNLIKTLSAKFPALELQPKEVVTDMLIADLLESRLDTAIVALPISEPDLQEYALFEEDFVLVRPLSDADEPVPSPKNLREMRLLLLAEGHCFRNQALSFCQLKAAEPLHFMEGSSLTTLVQMVDAGMGVTLIPEMSMQLETRSAAVSVARFPQPSPSRKIGMIWRRKNPLAEQLTEIGSLLRETWQTEQRKAPSSIGAPET